MAKLVIGGVTYNSAPSSASNLPYDNSDTSLSATTVQDAIDELADGVGAIDYDNLSDKPQVNGVTLSGDKDSQDLGVVWQGTQAQYDAITTKDANTVYFITDAPGTVLATVATTGSYNDLLNKPTIDTSLNTASSNAIANGPVASFAQSISQTVSDKMDKANPSGTGSFSLNRSGATGTESVSIGHNCVASGVYSYAEGMGTTSSGNTSHAEGYQTTSSGYYTHAEGWKSTASGTESHAEGDATQATGDYSHSEGMGTIAQRRSQHVFGEYNEADTGGTAVTTKGNYIEIVGKGTGDVSRSNARTLDWNGNEVLAGGLKVNGNNDVLAISPDYTSIAKNASATITMTKANGILIITRGRTAQIATISYYALAVHNGSYVNFELLTNTADNTVTLTTLGSRQLQISTTADYGISFRLLEF